MPHPPEASASPILHVEDVHFRYQRRSAAPLAAVTFSLRRGERCVVMGHNGSGKTTLLRVCAGLVRPHHGSVRLEGGSAPVAVERPTPDVGYIPQHLGLVRTGSALDNVLCGTLGRARGWRRAAGAFAPEAKETGLEWLHRLGLGHKVHERVDRLSGGERQRVAIARALVQRPRLLVADEFVSSLDMVRQQELLQLLRNYAERQPSTLLMALHDFEAARQFATRFLFLQHGRLVADLAADQVHREVVQRLLAA